MRTDSSSAELEAIARQALASFESRRSLFGLSQKRSADYVDAVAAFRAFVRKIDPNRFNEEQLSEVVAIIGRFVTFLEDYLASRVSHRDVTQRIFLADSIGISETRGSGLPNGTLQTQPGGQVIE